MLQLGAEFAVRLEAPHVVNMRKQVYAGVMLSGPAGKPLQATYRFTNEVTFQVTACHFLSCAFPNLVFCSQYRA